MTAKTRRRVIACAVAMALALPAESILLQAIATPSTEDRPCATWAQSLSPDDLLRRRRRDSVVPGAVPKGDHARLVATTARRDLAQSHPELIDTNPHLSSDAMPVLEAAIRLITPTLFIQVRRQTAQGRRAHRRSDFGHSRPRRGGVSFLPPRTARRADRQHRAAGHAADELRPRMLIVVLANAEDCDCSSEWGCDGYGGTCRTSVRCNVDSEWPSCGWLWNEDCNGLCHVGACESEPAADVSES